MYFTYNKNNDYLDYLHHNKFILGDDFIVFNKCPYTLDETNDYRYQTDLARLMWLIDNPKWIWIDSDILVLKKPDFNLENKPYYYNVAGEPDICAIFGNNCADHFKEVLSYYKKLMKDFTPKQLKCGWYQNYLSTIKSDLCFIPDGYFMHKGIKRR